MSIRIIEFIQKRERQMEPSSAPKLYTSLARYYDRLESQYRNYDEDSLWIAKVIQDPGAKSIADISCGTGNHISRLSRSNVERFTVAMDSSKEMVSFASRKSGKNVEFARADFLKMPFVKETFDCAICMYWSLAGLDEELVFRLFEQVHSILTSKGIFIFDVENSEGIRENLVGTPFVDSLFIEDNRIAVIRANYSQKIAQDVVDWHAYYLIEEDGISKLVEDRMNLRFYSRDQLESLLSKSGFETIEVSSGPFKLYEKNSPSLYFVAQKKN